MKCSNCYHRYQCKDDFTKRFGNQETVEDKCMYFKDESKIIELPCKIGDKYYRVEKFCNENGVEEEFTIHFPWDCERCCVKRCNKEYRIVEYTFNSAVDILDKSRGFGSSYYLSYDEAQQVLNKKQQI